MTVIVVVALTGNDLILNVAVVAPAATVTDAGTDDAAVLLVTKVTTAPPVGAALLSVTVHTLGVPPTTDVGLSVSVKVLTTVMERTAVALPTFV